MILPLMNPLPLFQHAFMQASQTRMCYAHVLPPRRSASRTSSQIGACHNARFRQHNQERGELHVCSKPRFGGCPLREDSSKLLGACLPEFHLHRCSIIRNHGSVAPAGDELLAWRKLGSPSTKSKADSLTVNVGTSCGSSAASFARGKEAGIIRRTWYESMDKLAVSCGVKPARRASESCLCLAVRHSLLSALCHELNRCVISRPVHPTIAMLSEFGMAQTAAVEHLSFTTTRAAWYVKSRYVPGLNCCPLACLLQTCFAVLFGVLD